MQHPRRDEGSGGGDRVVRLSLLSTTLGLIATGVLVQALVAGMFLSGTDGARMIHVGVAAVLPYLTIVSTVSAWRQAGRGVVPRGVAVGSTLLLIGMWVQEALGHMPWPVTTVIHVPLGVLLFALALGLTFAVWSKKAPVLPRSS